MRRGIADGANGVQRNHEGNAKDPASVFFGLRLSPGADPYDRGHDAAIVPLNGDAQMVEYAMRNTYDNSVLIGRRAVAVLNRAKSIRTGREDTECVSIHRCDVEVAAAALASGDRAFGLARPWPMLAAQYWKIAADDSRWVELDADGFRVDGASAKGL